jgi:LPS-assembly protein
VLNPSVSYPLISNPAFYLTPKVALHSTYYAMGANNNRAYSSSSRTLPLYSVDGGWRLSATGICLAATMCIRWNRVLSMYMCYTRSEYVTQFDTGQAGFDFTQMFSENRFTGMTVLAMPIHHPP